MSEPFIGQILLFAGNFAPRGYAFCQGQILSINSNQSLFSLLGTQYGGDGRSTFGLPDLRGRVPISMGTGAGLSQRNIGQKGGSEQVALTAAEMPSHQHAEGASTLSAELVADAANTATESVPDPARVLSKLANVNFYSSSDANLEPIVGPSISSTIGDAGLGQSHENRQPLIAIHYIIALTGIFPSRN